MIKRESNHDETKNVLRLMNPFFGQCNLFPFDIFSIGYVRKEGEIYNVASCPWQGYQKFGFQQIQKNFIIHGNSNLKFNDSVTYTLKGLLF